MSRRHKNYREERDDDEVKDDKVKDDKVGDEIKKYNDRLFNRDKKKLYIAGALILMFAFGFIVNGAFSGVTGYAVAGQMTGDQVGQKVVDFLEAATSANEIELVSVEQESGLYLVNVNLDGSEMSLYATMDGALAAPNVYEMDDYISGGTGGNGNTGTTVPKTDQPTVDLFVMSYCPYGLQAQKAMLPVMEILGDKADINIRFVYYAMHGWTEIEENTRQYCIQEEQPDKFIDYLTCFTQTGEVETCLAQAGVNTAQLNACTDAADIEFSITANYEDEESWLSGYYPLYDVDKELNEQYDVGGSPTLVINGVQVSATRSPEAYKEAICDAFTTPPAGCNTELSTDTTSTGIGTGTGGSSSGGCA